jgi:hypothetical protein
VVFGVPDRRHLIRWDLVIVHPAAKIGISNDPRIGREYRVIVLGNHDGIASCFEGPHDSPPFPTVATLNSFSVCSCDPQR